MISGNNKSLLPRLLQLQSVQEKSPSSQCPWPPKVCGPYVLTLPNWKPVFELLYRARLAAHIITQL